MPVDLSRNFLRLLVHFRRQDMVAFTDEHKRLYEEARSTGDFGAVTAHYYSVMAPLIDEYFNGNFHFAPPSLVPKEGGSSASEKVEECKTGRRLETLEETLRRLHIRVGNCLQLECGKQCVDIGCGLGGVMRDLAHTGAQITGVTIAKNEVEIGNERFRQLGIDGSCRLVEADCRNMAVLETLSQDAAYAIYSLKYVPKLEEVLSEVARILKVGGRFVVYDLLKTPAYDEQRDEHRSLLSNLSFFCGMPSLHHRSELIEVAARSGLSLVESIDLGEETGHPFYHCFKSSTLFMWLIRSRIADRLVRLGECARILPRGFHAFNRMFLAGTVDAIVRAGEMGILSGAEILVFEKAS